MHGDCHLLNCWAVYLYLSPKVRPSHAAFPRRIEYRNSGCFCPSNQVQSDLKGEKVRVSTKFSSFSVMDFFATKRDKAALLLLKMLHFWRMAAALSLFLLPLQPSQLFRALVLKETLNYALGGSFRAIKLSHVASCPMSLPKLRMFQHHLLRSFYMMLT